MKSLVIKNVPEELHARLKRNAQLNHRSLNKEVIAVLEGSVFGEDGQRADAFEVLERIDAHRAQLPDPGFTMEQIDRFIDEGRP
jgi:plasmid stability protein